MRNPFRIAFITAVIAAAALAIGCFGDPTGPASASSRGTVSLALDPLFPPIMVAASASEVEPFNSVRVTIVDDAGVVQFDTVIEFPEGAESVQLPAQVRLPPGTGDAGVQMTLTMSYINSQRDTVFRGGPTRITIRPDGAGGSPQQISIEVVHSGTGANAARVSISPAGGTAVAGTTTVFSATAFDESGAPIAGTPVVFTTADPALAELASPASGAVTWRAMRGTARIIATLLNGRADTASLQVILPASRIVVVSGDGQSAIVGKALPSPIVVRAEAADGVGVEGVEVSFAVTSGGGSVSGGSAVTDADGLASVGWTLGETVGPQTLAVSAAIPGGAEAGVSAIALPRVPAELAITIAPGEVVAGAPFEIAAAVRDAEGALVTTFSDPVSIALDPAVGPLNASLGGTLTVQPVAGVATFSGLSMTLAGQYRLTVTSGDLPPAGTGLTVVPAAASALVIVGGDNQSGVVGEPLPGILTVRLRDAFDNSIVGATINFSGLAGGMLVEPATAVTNSLGQASTRVVLGTVAGTHTVGAAVASMTDLSAAFTVTAIPGPPVALEIVSGDAQSIVIGSALQSAPFVVRVVDTYGNGVSDYDVEWLLVSDVGASLDVSLTTTDGNGEASATLTLPLELGPVVVEAMAADLAGSPVVFTVTVIPPLNSPLLFLSDPGNGVYLVNLAVDSSGALITCTISSCLGANHLAMNPARTLVAVPFGSGVNLGFLSTATGLYVGEVDDASFDEPYAATFTANGAEVWVVNRFGPESDTGTVSVVNVGSQTEVALIEHASFSSPEGIAIAGGRAFVANAGNNSVTVITVATRTVLSSIAFATPGQPSHVVATPNGAFVYVSTNDARVYKINTATLAVTEIVLAGGFSRNLAVHPAGTTVYAALQNGSIAVINVATNVVATLTFGNASSTYAVAISSDGLFGFVTDQEIGVVHVFSTLANAELFAPGFPIVEFSDPRSIVAK